MSRPLMPLEVAQYVASVSAPYSPPNPDRPKSLSAQERAAKKAARKRSKDARRRNRK